MGHIYEAIYTFNRLFITIPGYRYRYAPPENLDFLDWGRVGWCGQEQRAGR